MSLGHVPDITQQTSLWEVMGVCVCPSICLSVYWLHFLLLLTCCHKSTGEGDRRKGGFIWLTVQVLSRRSHVPDDEVAEQTAPTVRNPRAVAAGAHL